MPSYKYIAYCRKSTDEKDKQVLSIEAQIAELQEFAKRENLEIVSFITESRTAKVPGRSELNKVLNMIEKRMANAILSWHPDRLARNSIDGGRIIYMLDTCKLLDLKFPTFWFDNTPQGKFMLNIAFGQSKYYVDNLSENIKRGNRQKLRNGVWPSKAPLGYINEPILRSIEVDKEESLFVKQAFDKFASEAVSLTEVARYLHSFGIKRRVSGKPLTVGSVRKMLSNEFYVGIMTYAGIKYEASHQTFISKELFQKVQLRLAEVGKPRKRGHNFAFTRFIKCGECGAAVTGEEHIKYYPTTRGKVRYVYYRCTKKIKPCTQKYISELKLEEQVRGIVRPCGIHEDWKPYFEEWMARDEVTEKQNCEEVLTKLSFEIQELDIKLNRLLDTYLEQIVEPEVYQTKKNELFERKLKLQEKMSVVKEKGSTWLEPMREFMDCAILAQKIARVKNNPDELRSIGKKVGSNYLFLDGRLEGDRKYEFAALAANGGAACAAPTKSSIACMVDAEGLEPPTSFTSRKRSGQLS